MSNALNIRKGNPDDRVVISDTFVHAFFPRRLRSERMAEKIKDIFIPEYFHLYVQENIVVAMVAELPYLDCCMDLAKFRNFNEDIQNILYSFHHDPKFPSQLIIPPDTKSLEFFSVNKDFRCEGWGQKLMAYILENARDKNLLVLIENINRGIIGFYRRYGFKQIGNQPRFADEQDDFDYWVYMLREPLVD